MTKLEKWKALSWQERRLLLTAVFLLPAISLALRITGFKKTHSLLSSLTSRKSEPQDTEKVAASTARMVQIAGSYGFYRATCLPQSLCIWWLLQRQNIPCELFIGTQKEGETLKSHAWVELSGHVLNDPQSASRYVPILEMRTKA